MVEKKISEITLRLEEGMKHDLQDMAAHEDRTLSEVIRIILECHLYGFKARADAMCSPAKERQTMRGSP